jgi:hypothetical protein
MRVLRWLAVLLVAFAGGILLSPAAAQEVTTIMRAFNGTAPEPVRTQDLSNSTVSTTLTARSIVGVALFDKPGRWSVFSSPAAGSQGTASIAAEAAVRHVVDCISFSASAVVAPALTAGTVNLRDGATGAGTVLMAWSVAIPAATGQSVAPFGLCGLNLVGTTNTAMTLEFAGALANLSESVSITGYNIN